MAPWFSASWQAIPPEAVWVAPIATLLGYTVLGLTGFGAGLTATPLLAHVLALRFIVPMQLLLDVTATCVLGSRVRARVNRQEALWIVPFMLIGMAAGAILLIDLAQRTLLLALGAIVFLYGLVGAFGGAPKRRMARFWVVPFSLAGGVAGVLVGTGGPLYAMVLASRIEDKHELRATITAVLWVSATARFLIFLFSGLLSQEGLLLAFVLLVPFVLGGLALGNRLHRLLPAAGVRRAICFLLIASGISLLTRGV